MSKTEKVHKPSTTELVRTKVIEKIDSGFPLEDKNHLIDLRKQIVDELKLKGGWRGKVKDTINDVLIEKNIQVEGMSLSKIKNVKLIKDEFVKPLSPQQPQNLSIFGQQSNNNPTQPNQVSTSRGVLPIGTQQSRGVLPMGMGSQPQNQTIQNEMGFGQQILAPMTEAQKKTQKQFIKKSFGFIGEIYQAIGLVEGSDEEKKEEPIKPLAEFKKEVDDFADEVNDALLSGDVRLPQWANLLTLVIGAFMIFGMPIVKTLFFAPPKDGKAKVTHNKSLDDIEVKI